MATSRLRKRAPFGATTRIFELLDARLLLASDTCPSDPLPTAAADLSALLSNTFQAADAGSTMSTAYDLGQLGTTQSFNGYVGGYDPSDVMRFTLSGQSQFDLQLTGLQADIDMYLFNGNGQRLATSDRSGTSSEEISGTLDAGTYYILVVPWGWSVSTYVLTVGASAVQPVTPPSTPDRSDHSHGSDHSHDAGHGVSRRTLLRQ